MSHYLALLPVAHFESASGASIISDFVRGPLTQSIGAGGSAMRIELEKLEESRGRFSEVYQELSLDEAELRLIEPVQVEGRARRKQAGEVELNGSLRTRLSAPCARCLKPVELPIEVVFSERFAPAVAWRDQVQHELDQEDLNLAAFDGQGIELDDLVKEEVLLAVPTQVLCRPDCQGLCPVCGVDRNENGCECETKMIDSRWEKLKDLSL